MLYLLDKNIISNSVLRNEDKRDDLCVLEEVVDEFKLSSLESARLKSNGVHVVSVAKKHLEQLKDVVTVHGGNLQLINLYKAKGGADVMMVAYVLAEINRSDNLFPESYTIVTKDQELTSVAKSYGIPCVTKLP